MCILIVMRFTLLSTSLRLEGDVFLVTLSSVLAAQSDKTPVSHVAAISQGRTSKGNKLQTPTAKKKNLNKKLKHLIALDTCMLLLNAFTSIHYVMLKATGEHNTFMFNLRHLVGKLR